MGVNSLLTHHTFSSTDKELRLVTCSSRQNVALPVELLRLSKLLSTPIIYQQCRWRPWERGKALRAMPHAASKGFGAPVKKHQDAGAARKDKSTGAARNKEHARISGTSSKVISTKLTCLPGPMSSHIFPLKY